jgi:phosphorylcholine metabolism protein LicD
LWGSYRRQRIPFHQVATYAALCECDEILSTYNIPYFLYGGALLGAARANNIAGRPGDIDIAVCELNRENFIKLERKFIETGFKLVLNRSHKNKATLYYKYGCDLDFQFFGPISHDIDVHYKLEKYLFPENVSRLESVEIFGRKFHAPNDFEGFLERYYGSEWRTPIKTKDKNNFHKVRDEELRKFLNDDPKT